MVGWSVYNLLVLISRVLLMVGSKRALRVARADDDEDQGTTSLLARSQELTRDHKRLRTSVAEACAQVDVVAGASQRVDWVRHFDPVVADSFIPQAPTRAVKTARRYANSVRFP